MCAIAYFLEKRGISTTGIALVRENAEALKPPRLLWTPFQLGRPLGAPGDATFQTDVIRHALDLLERADVPVLADYPRDAPEDALGSESEPLVCPVVFSREEPTTWRGRLAAEFETLSPWYEIAVQRNGRTSVGLVERSVNRILEDLGELLDETAGSREAFFARALVDGVIEFKQGLEDAKAFYQEALGAQPSHRNAQAIHDWLWHMSSLGAALIEVFEAFGEHEKLASIGRVLVPRSAIGGSTG